MNSTDEIFGSDDEKENQGVWVEVKQGIAYLIASHDREEHMALFREKTAPYRAAIISGVADEKQNDAIAVECLAKKVLLNWRGVVDSETGEPIPYTWQEGVKAMTKNRRFKEFVLQNATKYELFRKTKTEEEQKNS